MQDELEDLSEQANDIQEVMGRSYGMPELDDDDLDAELDALGDELDLEDSSYLDDAVATPSVPSSEPGADSMRVRDYFKSPKMAAFELELILFERSRWKDEICGWMLSCTGLTQLFGQYYE